MSETTKRASRSASVDIAVEDVSVSRGGTPILRGTDLHVRAGEFLCILGLSGSGKSTLLRAIGHLIPASTGSITIDGRPAAEAWQELAYVFQTPQLIPWRTVADNVRLGMQLRFGRTLSPQERKRRADKVEEVLDLVGLDNMASRRANVLSGGEQQRVSVARALAVEPRALLLDEPFSALDVRIRDRLRSVVLDIWERTGVTVVFVTHDVGEAVVLGDRAVILDGKPSRVVADIDIALERPRDPHSIEFRARVERISSKIVLPE